VSLAPLIDAAVRLAQEGRLDESIERFESLLDDHPDEPAVLFDLGVAYGLAERFQESAATFETLLNLEPDRTDTHEHRARALVAMAAQIPHDERLDLLQEAIGHIETVLKVAPQRGEAIAVRADAHRLAGRVDKAAADYSLAGQRAGENHRWTLVAADMFFHERRWDQALSLLEEMVRERPEHVEALRMLGAARAEAGDLEGAASALQRALTLDPDDAAALRLLERVVADSDARSGEPLNATAGATSNPPSSAPSGAP
jgi:tetratricopeptide (TPR) repeat protein